MVDLRLDSNPDLDKGSLSPNVRGLSKLVLNSSELCQWHRDRLFNQGKLDKFSYDWYVDIDFGPKYQSMDDLNSLVEGWYRCDFIAKYY